MNLLAQNAKLCILRLSAIGDVCHAVAMVERIQRTRPDIEITWIIGKIEHLLVGDIPGVNFIIFDKSKGWGAYGELSRNLKQQMFDALFVMQVATRANIASLFINAKIKIGFDKARSKELHGLFVNTRIKPQRHAHVLDGFMAFADCAGIPDGGTVDWHIPLSDADKSLAHSHKQELGRYVVICPSASNPDRNWTIENYKQIAAHLKSKGYPVVLVGGPGQREKELALQIAEDGNVALNLVGKTSLKELLAVLKEASLVIAPDTGPAHMASCVNTNVVGLYAHSNPRRTGPYNNTNDVVSVYEEVIEQQKGGGWQDLPWGTRAQGSQIMERISVETVSKQIDKLLDS